jgi:hypothetical protein
MSSSSIHHHIMMSKNKQRFMTWVKKCQENYPEAYRDQYHTIWLAFQNDHEHPVAMGYSLEEVQYKVIGPAYYGKVDHNIEEQTH